MTIKDEVLLKIISEHYIQSELIQLADWHQSVAEDKSFHKGIALAHNQPYVEKEEYQTRRDRHLKIAKACRNRAKQL